MAPGLRDNVIATAERGVPTINMQELGMTLTALDTHLEGSLRDALACTAESKDPDMDA